MTINLRLDNATVLITGASSGIGRHLAVTLAGSGARVGLLARRADRLRSIADEIGAQGGVAAAIPVDLANPADIAPAVEAAEAALGPATILINNAGLFLPKDALSTTAADLDAMYAVNVRGAFLMARAVGAAMIRGQSGGRIVNIASIAGLRPLDVMGTYGMTKAALIHMTKVLAREWRAHNINVNAICPGYFATEMTADAFATPGGAAAIARLPRGRVGQVEDVVSAVGFLISEESHYVNGAVISVDDGLSVYP